MRSRVVTIAALIGLAWTAAPLAAADAVAVDSANRPVLPLQTGALSAVEKAVLAADASWGTAYQTCDLKIMGNLLHDDLLFIHLHARVDQKPAMMKEFSGCPNESTLTEPIRVRMLTAETAVVEGNLKLRSKGSKNLLQILYTRVYTRADGGWKMIAHQSTMNPGLDAAGKPLPNPSLGATNAPAAAPGAGR